MEFPGKVVLVTGAARGIGKAICDGLLEKGCKVCCTDVNVEKGEKVVSEFQQKYGKEKSVFFKCDVSSRDEFAAAFLKTREVLGTVDILVNNAGVGDGKIVDINLNGVINGCSLAYETMGKHNGGNGGFVVNISSITALVPFPFHPVYAATKAGIVALTRSYAHPLHYNKSGIIFTAICPCGIDTELFWLTTEKTIFVEEYNKIRSELQLSPPSFVKDAVIQIIREKRNGGIMTVIGGKENEYAILPGEEMLREVLNVHST